MMHFRGGSRGCLGVPALTQNFILMENFLYILDAVFSLLFTHLWTLQLHDIAFDDLLGRWCHAKFSHTFVQALNFRK